MELCDKYNTMFHLKVNTPVMIRGNRWVGVKTIIAGKYSNTKVIYLLVADGGTNWWSREELVPLDPEGDVYDGTMQEV